MNCSWKWIERKNLGWSSANCWSSQPAQISSYTNSLSVYNSLSAAIHLYMIRALVPILAAKYTYIQVAATARISELQNFVTSMVKRILTFYFTAPSWGCNFNNNIPKVPELDTPTLHVLIPRVSRVTYFPIVLWLSGYIYLKKRVLVLTLLECGNWKKKWVELSDTSRGIK